MVKYLSVLAAGFILTACSDGPGSSDIEEAIELRLNADIQKSRSALESFAGKAGQDMADSVGLSESEITVDVTVVDEFTKNDDGEFVGNINADISREGETRSSQLRVVMTEVDGEWRLLDLNPL